MAFTNFKLDTDSDGIALVTWDMPGKSMNVFDESVMAELDAIIDQTAADATVKGVVITSAKEFFCAGADINMLEGIALRYAEMVRAQGEDAAIAHGGEPGVVVELVATTVSILPAPNTRPRAAVFASAAARPIGPTRRSQ